MAAKRKSGDCSLAADGENGRHFGTKSEDVPRVTSAGRMEREMPTEEKVPKFFLLSAKTALQLANRGGSKSIETSISFRRQVLRR